MTGHNKLQIYTARTCMHLQVYSPVRTTCMHLHIYSKHHMHALASLQSSTHHALLIQPTPAHSHM